MKKSNGKIIVDEVEFNEEIINYILKYSGSIPENITYAVPSKLVVIGCDPIDSYADSIDVATITFDNDYFTIFINNNGELQEINKTIKELREF